jgi:hypothetical protein
MNLVVYLTTAILMLTLLSTRALPYTPGHQSTGQKMNMLAILKLKHMPGLLIMLMMMQLTMGYFYSFYSIHFTSLPGGTTTLLGLCYFLSAVSEVPFLLNADRLFEKLGVGKLMCICAHMLKEREELPDNKVISTLMSNVGFHKFMKKEGFEVGVTEVGDRYVLDRMLEDGAVFGGEQSGHIIFLNHATTGDGILSSLQLLQAMISSGKTASQASEEIELYPQVLKNARVRIENKFKYDRDEEVNAEVDQICEELGEEGRVLIRPSSTEPLVRVMIEGQDIEDITAKAQKLARLITKRFS